MKIYNSLLMMKDFSITQDTQFVKVEDLEKFCEDISFQCIHIKILLNNLKD